MATRKKKTRKPALVVVVSFGEVVEHPDGYEFRCVPGDATDEVVASALPRLTSNGFVECTKVTKKRRDDAVRLPRVFLREMA